MSGRFVRASKYRHVHGEPTRKDKCILDCKISNPSTESFGLACSTKYIAWPSTGGGGPIQVREIGTDGRGPRQNLNFLSGKCLDLEFSPFMSKMLALGDANGVVAIAVLKPNLEEKQTEPAAKLVGHGKKISMVRFNNTANNILASSSHDQTVRLWDIQQQACITNIGGDVLTTGMAWSPTGDRLACHAADKKLHVYDPREEGKNETLFNSVAGSRPSRPFWIDDNHVGVVGSNRRATREIKVFDVRNAGEAIHEMDIDQGSGILAPYFDEDTSVLFLGGKGDGNIRYYEWSEGKMFNLNEFRSSSSQKGLCWLPKRSVNVESCEIAHAFRLMRDYIEPVSFKVPRKSEIFQEDIFPNAYAGVPALEAAQWAEGKNGTPSRISMNPADRGDCQEVEQEFQADKSPAELKAELAEAHARIAELEAEVAKLKAS